MGAQDASVAGVAVPARLRRRGALGVGRVIGGEPSSKIDRGVIGSVGCGVAKGPRGHVTTAMRNRIEENLRILARDEALVVATPRAVVLEVQAHAGATKGRR